MNSKTQDEINAINALIDHINLHQFLDDQEKLRHITVKDLKRQLPYGLNRVVSTLEFLMKQIAKPKSNIHGIRRSRWQFVLLPFCSSFSRGDLASSGFGSKYSTIDVFPELSLSWGAPAEISKWIPHSISENDIIFHIMDRLSD